MLPHEIRVLAERSMGNPMFLEELWRAHRSGAPVDALPDSVDSAVTAQIDHLSPRDRQVLRYAAVLGTTFTERELIELLGTARPTGAIRSRPRTDGVPPALQEFLSTERSGLIRFRSAIGPGLCLRGPAVPSAPRSCTVGPLPPWRPGAGTTARPSCSPSTTSTPSSSKGRGSTPWWPGIGLEQKYANVEAANLYQRALAAVVRLPEVDQTEVASAWEASATSVNGPATTAGLAGVPAGSQAPRQRTWWPRPSCASRRLGCPSGSGGTPRRCAGSDGDSG